MGRLQVLWTSRPYMSPCKFMLHLTCILVWMTTQ